MELKPIIALHNSRGIINEDITLCVISRDVRRAIVKMQRSFGTIIHHLSLPSDFMVFNRVHANQSIISIVNNNNDLLVLPITYRDV